MLEKKPKISEQAFKEAIEFLGLELKDNGTKCKPWLLARRDGVVYDIYLGGLEEKEGKRHGTDKYYGCQCADKQDEPDA